MLVAWLVWAARANASAAGFDVWVPSAKLSAFFGHPVAMHAEILTPHAYDTQPERRFPAIYYVHPFGGTFRPPYAQYERWRDAIERAPEPLVVVFLDATYPAGHNEFANSANDGPWGEALTTEFVPELERRLRLQTSPRSRFLAGHSSGGWSVLWLQLTYPTFFGGAWSIAPDPLDFHDFTGIDLVARPPENAYRDAAGRLRPFVRVRGRDTSTIERYVTEQSARTGGQFDSFDAVFGPRGPDGRPVPLFDRATGAIDPAVAAYWEARYDLTALARRSWPQIGPDLTGKLHVFVGTQDTFHLESSVARFRDALAALGSDARFTFVPGADHWSVFNAGGDLIARIVTEAGRTYARER